MTVRDAQSGKRTKRESDGMFKFCAVVDEGSLSRASKRLFMSQPAISAHIKSLEEQLGLTLFHRVGRRSVVGKAGEVLYQKAGELFALADDLKTVTGDLRGTQFGRIHVGISLEWEHLLPRALGRYKAAYPAVEVLLTVHECDEVEKMTLGRMIDVGFISRASTRPELESQPILVDKIVPIVNQDHPLANAIDLTPKDLSRELIFVRESGSTGRETTDKMLQECGLSDQIAMGAASHEAIRALVLAGAGVGFVPRSCLGANGSAVPVSIIDLPGLCAPLNRT
ncbi:MAG: LysR substrate-binding domain-containing protein [SAR202 cluster bacterium]|nr:LysR substrate-binding domain-containing protein [SAR202 cluster bacterium]